MKITLTSFLLHSSVLRSGILLDFVFPLCFFGPLDLCPLGARPNVQLFKMHAGFEWTALRHERGSFIRHSRGGRDIINLASPSALNMFGSGGRLHSDHS